MRALAALRDRAVAQADPALLVDVDVPGSLPDRADRAVLASLAAQGTRVAGRTSRVTHTRLVDAVGAAGEDGSQAWVEVTVVSSEHRLVSSAGATTLVPASAPVTSLLVLAREAGRWRVAGSA